MTYEAALTYLHALPRFAGEVEEAELGLDRIQALLEAMGRPQEAFSSIHVAGTNGKGSTASLLAAMATAAGRRTGLHTSPHLCAVTERMRIDGRPAPESWLAGAVGYLRPAFEAVEPSFFEATVALSLRYFAEEDVDLAVVEAGLGGRLDATNVLRPAAALITHIGLDHTAILGDTLPAIAREKGGIIKPEVPLFVSANAPAVVAVLREMAEARNASFHFVPGETDMLKVQHDPHRTLLDVRTPLRTYRKLAIGLAGRHQQANALLALRTAEEGLEEVRTQPGPAARGLKEVVQLAGLRGRLEVIQKDPTIIVDVGHNPDALAAALHVAHSTAVKQQGQLSILFGLMRDKDVHGMARLLAESKAEVSPAALSSRRALPAEDLARHLRAAGASVRAPDTPGSLLARFREEAAVGDVLLIVGSHRLAAQLPAFCSMVRSR